LRGGGDTTTKSLERRASWRTVDTADYAPTPVNEALFSSWEMVAAELEVGVGDNSLRRKSLTRVEPKMADCFKVGDVDNESGGPTGGAAAEGTAEGGSEVSEDGAGSHTELGGTESSEDEEQAEARRARDIEEAETWVAGLVSPFDLPGEVQAYFRGDTFSSDFVVPEYVDDAAGCEKGEGGEKGGDGENGGRGGGGRPAAHSIDMTLDPSAELSRRVRASSECLTPRTAFEGTGVDAWRTGAAVTSASAPGGNGASFRAAQCSHRAALTIAHANADRESELSLLLAMAQLEMGIGDEHMRPPISRALRYCERAAAIAQNLGRKRERGDALCGVARAKALLTAWDTSLVDHVVEAAALYAEGDNFAGQASALLLASEELVKLGLVETACDHAEIGVEQLREAPLSHKKGNGSMLMAKLLVQHGTVSLMLSRLQGAEHSLDLSVTLCSNVLVKGGFGFVEELGCWQATRRREADRPKQIVFQALVDAISALDPNPKVKEWGSALSSSKIKEWAHLLVLALRGRVKLYESQKRLQAAAMELADLLVLAMVLNEFTIMSEMLEDALRVLTALFVATTSDFSLPSSSAALHAEHYETLNDINAIEKKVSTSVNHEDTHKRQQRKSGAARPPRFKTVARMVGRMSLLLNKNLSQKK